ncbi:MAG TPA: phosphatase PAP2 family protein [Gaiellales bacterium]
MLLAVLTAVSVAAGLAAWSGARMGLRTRVGAAPAARAGDELQGRTRIGVFVRSRLDAEVVTGLALTVALVALVLAGIVVAALAIAVRHAEALSDLDSAAATWAHRNEGPGTHRALEDVTALATTSGVIVIAVAVGLIEWIRVPSRAIPAYLLIVTIGDSAVTNTVKEIVARARPAIDPAAAALGPSFPSGHSSTAAAFYAALALLAGRRRTAGARAVLAGVAVGVAAAVACSRVMLDLHWVSDVVAGLALGWGWFAACTIAFGGWLLRFGEPVAAAATPAPRSEARSRRSRSSGRTWRWPLPTRRRL